ncbi:uncharacterized protein [Haliotis cracherodii]|uniref:uncharacterized protein n=1 Tax=Haliotis cracherodii TaxID=6455 RepID=UPI0039E9C418
MMDYSDNFNRDVSYSSTTDNTDGRQQPEDVSSRRDLAEPRPISQRPREDVDSGMAFSLRTDESGSVWQNDGSLCVFTGNEQSYHMKNNYSTSSSKDIGGEFAIGIRETCCTSQDYGIRNPLVADTSANRHCHAVSGRPPYKINNVSDKSTRRRRHIQTAVIVAAFVLSSILLLCILILALV